MKKDYNGKAEIEAYLTIQDIMELFRCKREKAYQIVNVNGFPAMRLGRTILVEPTSLKAWMIDNKNSDFSDL